MKAPSKDKIVAVAARGAVNVAALAAFAFLFQRVLLDSFGIHVSYWQMVWNVWVVDMALDVSAKGRK